jgi:hypothetical protein
MSGVARRVVLCLTALAGRSPSARASAARHQPRRVGDRKQAGRRSTPSTPATELLPLTWWTGCGGKRHHIPAAQGTVVTVTAVRRRLI